VVGTLAGEAAAAAGSRNFGLWQHQDEHPALTRSRSHAGATLASADPPKSMLEAVAGEQSWCDRGAPDRAVTVAKGRLGREPADRVRLVKARGRSVALHVAGGDGRQCRPNPDAGQRSGERSPASDKGGVRTRAHGTRPATPAPRAAPKIGTSTPGTLEPRRAACTTFRTSPTTRKSNPKLRARRHLKAATNARVRVPVARAGGR
jgi:hypothetical protein